MSLTVMAPSLMQWAPSESMCSHSATHLICQLFQPQGLIKPLVRRLLYGHSNCIVLHPVDQAAGQRRAIAVPLVGAQVHHVMGRKFVWGQRQR